VLVPTTIATVGIMAGMAQGAIASEIVVSGQNFKISADRLEGDGFVQYGGQVSKTDDKGNKSPEPVAMSGIKRADLYNLCQSVVIPKAPISLTIRAGQGGTPAKAENLLIAMSDLRGDATFTNINIGMDAGSLNAANEAGKPQMHGATGAFGQQADHVQILGLKQTSWSTTAASFKLTGLTLKVNVGNAVECFYDKAQ
jgi:hypothetical protein